MSKKNEIHLGNEYIETINNDDTIEEYNENKIYRLTKAEREVILNIDDELKEWSAYVSSPSWMKKFEEAGWECVKEDHYANGDIVAKVYKAPAKQVIIAKKRKARNISEEEKEALRERVKLMQKNKEEKKKNK